MAVTLENERLKLQRMRRQLGQLEQAVRDLVGVLEAAPCPECGWPHQRIAHFTVDEQIALFGEVRVPLRNLPIDTRPAGP